MVLRTPVLCLDTNASIDFGVVLSLGGGHDAIAAQFKRISRAWEGLPYDEHVKSDVLSTLRSRQEQLLAAARFLRIADGHADMRLSKFAKLEHVRIRANPQALPPYSALVDPKDALDVALEVFGKTELKLQDAMILASAVVMGADALVSNDDDFGRAFNAGAGTLVRELAGKPIALLDHRGPLQPDATLHSAIAKSLDRRHKGNPWFGRPVHVDKRRDGGWYLAYRHPWPVDGAEPALVPGQHRLSVVDASSLIVCEVRQMYFFESSLPNGITSELAMRLANDYAAKEGLSSHLRLPDHHPGYIDVAIPLARPPEQWQNWTVAKRKDPQTKAESTDPHKKLAPRSAVAFVERPRKRI